MRQYSEERKESVLRKLFPPHNKSFRELSKEEAIPLSTIHTWVRKQEQEGKMSTKLLKVVSSWSVEARFAVIVETATLSEAELSVYCREKGLYSEQIKEWKAEFISRLMEKPSTNQGSKSQEKGDKKRIIQLEKEL